MLVPILELMNNVMSWQSISATWLPKKKKFYVITHSFPVGSLLRCFQSVTYDWFCSTL